MVFMTSFVQSGELVHNSNWVPQRHIQTVRRSEKSNFPKLRKKSGLKTDLKESGYRQDLSRSKWGSISDARNHSNGPSGLIYVEKFLTRLATIGLTNGILLYGFTLNT